MLDEVWKGPYFYLWQEVATSQEVSAMPTFKLYKDGKKVQGQFYLLYNLFFFFSKDKNL